MNVTCAGGLTRKAVRELAPLGLPPTAGLERVGYVAFAGATPRILDAVATTVRTVPRRDLGRFQLEWTRRDAMQQVADVERRHRRDLVPLSQSVVRFGQRAPFRND